MNNKCNLISSFVAVKTVDISCLDFRVGRIISVRNHLDADTLYVEESRVSIDDFNSYTPSYFVFQLSYVKKSHVQFVVD